MLALALIIAALVLAIVTLIQTKCTSLLAWAVVLISVALILGSHLIH